MTKNKIAIVLILLAMAMFAMGLITTYVVPSLAMYQAKMDSVAEITAKNKVTQENGNQSSSDEVKPVKKKTYIKEKFWDFYSPFVANHEFRHERLKLNITEGQENFIIHLTNNYDELGSREETDNRCLWPHVYKDVNYVFDFARDDKDGKWYLVDMIITDGTNSTLK